MKDWDFGWFGKGLTGYVHYKQAFDRSFPPEKQPTKTGHKQPEDSARSTKTDKDQPGKPAKAGSQAGFWLLVLAVAVLWYLVLLVQPR